MTHLGVLAGARRHFSTDMPKKFSKGEAEEFFARRKTANVVLNVAFDEKTIAVDTHIFRVVNRTGLAPGRNPREVEDALLKIVPDKYVRHAHHWLILHGRYVCVARKPLCPACRVRD